MEELRDLILQQLLELKERELLTEERYQLYVDTVYQCDTKEGLLELASMELQLEASDFYEQLKEQKSVLNENEFEQEGFEKAGFEQEGFEQEGFEKAGFEQEDFEKAGFEPDYLDTKEEVDETKEKKLEEAKRRERLHHDLFEDRYEDDYFDIDALFLSHGGRMEEITLGKKPKYQEGLDELVSAYDNEESSTEKDKEDKKDTESSVSNETQGQLGFNQSGFNTQGQFGFNAQVQSGFNAQGQVGFNAQRQTGFSQGQNGVPKNTGVKSQGIQPKLPTTKQGVQVQRQVKSQGIPVHKSEKQVDGLRVFSMFSKRN